MKFKLLTMENFFSYGEEERLDLSETGLYYITGNNEEQTESASNGSGKSTILEGICFALFGGTTKNMNVPMVVHEKIGKDCRVTLSFEIGIDSYLIERYVKHTKNHDKILFFKNEELISKANKKDTQDVIDGIIKINYKSFINSVLMSQENVGKFLENDPGKKKEIIENILQLNTITQYHWVAQNKRKIARKNYDRNDVEIKNLNSLVTNTKDSAIAYVNSCKAQKETANKRIADLKLELEKIDTTNIEEERAKIKQKNEVETLRKEKTADLDSHKITIKSFTDQLTLTEKSISDFNSLIVSSKKNKDKALAEIANLEKIIDKQLNEVEHARDNPDECPLCKSIINKDELEKWIKEKTQNINLNKDSIKDKNKTVKDEDKNISDFRTRIEEYNEKLSDLEKSKKEELLICKGIVAEIANLIIPETMDEDELNEISSSKDKINTEIESLENVDYLDKSYLDGLIKKAKDLRGMTAIKETDSKKYAKEVALYQWWENSLSSKKNSMKSWCVNNIIGYFNTKIKYYMDRFFDGDTEIQLDVELNETIKRMGFDRVFGMFSGGEKQRLNLAILFALNSLVKSSLSSKIDMMFLDEILSTSLDDKGISTVLNLLEEMKDNNETVFIIDHKDNFKDYPSFKQLYVNKSKDGFSHIRRIDQ